MTHALLRWRGGRCGACLSWPRRHPAGRLQAGRDRALAPPSRHCARRPARGDSAAHAGVGSERAGRGDGRPPSRRQDGHRVPRQCGAGEARRVRNLSAAVGRDRRDAGRDGRHPAHRLAHGGGFGARQPVFVARRCLAPAHGGRRRAGPPPRRRARLGAADPRGRAVEPVARIEPARWPARWRHGGSTSASPATWRPPCVGQTSCRRPPSPPSR